MKTYIFNNKRYQLIDSNKEEYILIDKTRNKKFEINYTIYLLVNYFHSEKQMIFNDLLIHLGYETDSEVEIEKIKTVFNQFISSLLDKDIIVEFEIYKKLKYINYNNIKNFEKKFINFKLISVIGENSRSSVKLYSIETREYILKFYKSKNKKMSIEKAKFEYDKLNLLKSCKYIVNVFDYKKFELDINNNNFIILEYIKGKSIFEKILNEKLDESTIIDIINQLIDCYSNLHKLEILHGDIHPSNIIYNNDSMIKIIDFGESIIIGEKTNKNAGLSFFCPPERINEISFNKFKYPINKQGEVYQISLVIYFILNKCIPFNAPKWSLLVEQIKKWSYKNKNYEFLVDNLNFKINKILEKGLSHNLDYRYKDIVELKKDWLL